MCLEGEGFLSGLRLWDNIHMASQATQLKLPERLLAEVEEAARAQGQSVNELLAEAVERYLKGKQWERLKSYARERARELGVDEGDIDRAIAESRADLSH